MRADGGISLATQEDTARETAAQRSEDVVFARDYTAIVEALRSEITGKRQRSWVEHPELAVVARTCRNLQFQSDALAHEVAALTFAEQWGFPALLRALARAIELETR